MPSETQEWIGYTSTMLVFTISNAVITVFTDTFTGVSKVRTVNRLYTDYY